MRHNYEAEHVFEYEYDKGYEWRVMDYADEKIEIISKVEYHELLESIS